jgi:hypothetical protein
MAAEFIEWVDNLKVSDSGEMQNIVVSAKYHVTCLKDGERLDNMFDVGLPAPSGEGFLAYETLSQEQVLSWVKSSLGQSRIDEQRSAMVQMIAQIVAAKQSKPRAVAAPWETQLEAN